MKINMCESSLSASTHVDRNKLVKSVRLIKQRVLRQVPTYLSLVRMTQVYEMERSTKIITPNMTFKTRRKKEIIVANSGFSYNNKCEMCFVVFVIVFYQLVMCSLVSGSQVTSINSTEVSLDILLTIHHAISPQVQAEGIHNRTLFHTCSSDILTLYMA